METLKALALPVAMDTIQTLSMIGAHTSNVSWALKALVTIVTRATRVILQDTQRFIDTYRLLLNYVKQF